jgi:hypothetical protein
MSASQAEHGNPHRSLSSLGQKPAPEKGWISRATYNSLPPLFQASARDLVKLGRIEIESVGGSEHGIGAQN